jgi:hypothetical protein
METQIKVLAARTQDETETKGADVEDAHFDMVAEAKKRAKYLLTEAFRLTGESADWLRFSQVLEKGEWANVWPITSEATDDPH